MRKLNSVMHAHRVALFTALTCVLTLDLGCSGKVQGRVGDDAGTVISGTGGNGGTGPSQCYSPTHNLQIAYQPNAVGCTCNPAVDADVCVQGVALICETDHWLSVVDGPCEPQVQATTYSPSSCTAAGGIPIASPGTALTAERDCASGVAMGIIDFASSGWDEGGLCCAPGQFCGARAGNTCASNEYCAYQAGDYCGAADAEATCKLRPQVCTDIYAPVCGCDKLTYPSACSAAAAGVGVYSNGECP
jgi:hypothetical protein